MQIKDITAKAKAVVQPGFDKVKAVTEPQIDKVKSATDHAKAATQPLVDKFMTHPQVEKARDGMDTMSGRRLEEKLAEYTDVYGDVLLGLHHRLESDRLEAAEKQQQMAQEISRLSAAVDELREQIARNK